MEENTAISISVMMSKNMYVRAARKYMAATGAITPLNAVLVPVTIAVTLFYLINRGLNIMSVMFFTVSALIGAIGGFIYFFLPTLRYRTIPALRERQDYSFSAACVTVGGGSGEVSHAWDSFSEILCGAEFYFFTRAGKRPLIIPAASFSPHKEINFLALLIEKSGRTKQLRKI